MAKVSGNLTQNAVVIVVDESTWTVEQASSKQAGGYEITGLTTGKKTVIARAQNGACLGYGNVNSTT